MITFLAWTTVLCAILSAMFGFRLFFIEKKIAKNEKKAKNKKNLAEAEKLGQIKNRIH